MLLVILTLTIRKDQEWSPSAGRTVSCPWSHKAPSGGFCLRWSCPAQTVSPCRHAKLNSCNGIGRHHDIVAVDTVICSSIALASQVRLRQENHHLSCRTTWHTDQRASIRRKRPVLLRRPAAKSSASAHRLPRERSSLARRRQRGRHQPGKHGKCHNHQCATAAAAASSINRPVLNRSSVKPALILCGSSRAIVWANTLPEPGVALNPPVPQPQLT